MPDHIHEWTLDMYEGGGDGSDLYRNGVYIARIDNTQIALEILAMLNAAEQLLNIEDDEAAHDKLEDMRFRLYLARGGE